MTNKVTTEDRGAVRILRINRPDRRNPVDGETAVGLGAAIEAFAADDRVRVLVVRPAPRGEGRASRARQRRARSGSSAFRRRCAGRIPAPAYLLIDAPLLGPTPRQLS
jgi:enoyl-CoA hydratase/carnithine racemase